MHWHRTCSYPVVGHVLPGVEVIMFKRFFGAGLILGLMALAAPAFAIPITGEVFTTGRYTTDTGDLANATAIDFSIAWTTGGTGSYASAASAHYEVSYHDFTFAPSPAAPVNPLWWFTDGYSTYSFVMNSVDVVTQTATALDLIGYGVLNITGYDPTPGSWSFTTTCRNAQCTGRFKFSAEATDVPEPGSLALIGLGLIGIGIARRRRQ